MHHIVVFQEGDGIKTSDAITFSKIRNEFSMLVSWHFVPVDTIGRLVNYANALELE